MNEEFCCTDILNAKKDIEQLEDELESLAETLQADKDELGKRITVIDDKLDSIQADLANRVPTWSSLLNTGLGTCFGILLGAIATYALMH